MGVGAGTAPTLSVVITCFNYEAFVADAIESVLQSTVAPLQLIVVDDGSTDGSAAVARRFDHVEVIGKPNGGMASALNAGAAAAVGDVLVLLDADDLVDPDRLGWVQGAFANDHVAVAWHPLRIVTLDGRERGTLPHEPLPHGDLVPAILRDGMPPFAVTSGIAVRRAAFDRVGPIPEDRFRGAAEGYLVRTLPFVGDVAATNRPLGSYRSHSASASRVLTVVEPEPVAAKLRRHLEVADQEHALLATAARQAGHNLTVARLRGLDPVYLRDQRLYARLSASSRRTAWRTMRELDVDPPRRLRVRRGLDAVAAACYVTLPARVAMAAYVVRGDHQLVGVLRLVARSYWTMRRLAAGVRERLGLR